MQKLAGVTESPELPEHEEVVGYGMHVAFILACQLHSSVSGTTNTNPDLSVLFSSRQKRLEGSILWAFGSSATLYLPRKQMCCAAVWRPEGTTLSLLLSFSSGRVQMSTGVLFKCHNLSSSAILPKTIKNYR